MEYIVIYIGAGHDAIETEMLDGSTFYARAASAPEAIAQANYEWQERPHPSEIYAVAARGERTIFYRVDYDGDLVVI